MSGEKWLPVVGASDYRVSDHGRVLSFRRRYPLPRFLTLLTNREGYRYLEIVTDEGTVRQVRVHQLVLEAFVGPPPPGHQTRHLDGDPANNHVSNLRWGTGSENTFDNVRNGTHRNARKTHCIHGHPFDTKNTYVIARGDRAWRGCRTCMRAQRAKQRAKRRALLVAAPP